jgi:hypothetical protein
MLTNSRYAALVALILLTFSQISHARIVEKTQIQAVDDNYQLEIQFATPMRFSNLSELGFARNFEIQLRPDTLLSGLTTEDLEGRYSVSWNRRDWSPLSEITYDGDDPEFPYITLRFRERVKLEVKNSADFMSVIVTVDASQITKPATAPKLSSADLLNQLDSTDSALQSLINEAKTAVFAKDYANAIRLLRQIRDKSTDLTKRRAHELLGVVRELNGQQAQAKREYEDFIDLYPDSPDTPRIRQRLAILVTTDMQAKSIGEVTSDAEWESDFYGSFGQRYYRDDNYPETGGSSILRDQLNTDLDFVHRISNGIWDIKTQFIGSYRKDFEDDTNSEFRPNVGSIEIENSDWGASTRIGRQSRNTDGILGRFDGIYTSYEVTPDIVVNASFGYPIDISRRDTLNSDVEFYGTSVNFLSVADNWNLSAYYIKQTNFSVTDREAVGGEARYSSRSSSLYVTVDYDVYFNELNSALFLGNWNLTDATRLNVSMDYRYSPTLTKLNAIQGQGVSVFSDLFPSFTDEELKQLALDRTARSTTVTTSLTHTINEQWQVIGDITATEFGATEASAGVEATPATGTDFYYSVQFVGTNVLQVNDVAIWGLRMSDTESSNTYTLTGNWRFSPNRKFRINPRIRVDYRANNNDSGDRWVTRPSIRLDYRLTKQSRIEFEAGYEWYDETYALGSYKNETSFVTLGYRLDF